MKSTSNFDELGNRNNYRADVDGLRAVAVLSVIIYHLNDKFLPGGFSGVDIFFVISGYVVTGSILKYEFNKLYDYLLSFYTRRMKRIVPNLIVVVLFFSLLSCLFIPPVRTGFIIETAFYSLFGVSNFYLAHAEFDYFGIGSAYNTFTHTWSLGVEEQFYLIYPVIVFAIQKYFKRPYLAGLYILVLLSLASIAMSWYFQDQYSEIAYYYMPSRFWELASGGALFFAQASGSKYSKNLSYALVTILQLLGVGLILFGLITASTIKGFPIPTAFPVVVGTIIVIALGSTGNNIVGRLLSAKPIVYIGLLSYSLYLWHWPIFTIFRWSIGLDSISTAFAAVLITVIFSWLSYKFVEQPCRKITVTTNHYKILLTGIIAMLLSGFFIIMGHKKFLKLSNNNSNPIVFQNIKLPTKQWPDFIRECHYKYYKDSEVEAIERCLSTPGYVDFKQTIYMLGDSHVQALLFMINNATNDLNVQVAQIHNNDIPKILNDKEPEPLSFEYTAEHVKSGDMVVVSFFHGKFYNISHHIPLDYDPMEEESVALRYENSKKYFTEFSKKLALKNANLLFIHDVPQLKNPIRVQQCVVQKKLGLPNACDVPSEQALHTRKPMSLLIDELAMSQPNVYEWDPFSLVCPEQICKFDDDRGLVMSDHNHISRELSESMGNIFKDFFVESGLYKKD